MTNLNSSDLEAIRRRASQWVPAEEIITDLRRYVDILAAEVERLRTDNAVIREIADALAHEDRCQSETGEGSMANLARLITTARAVLAEQEEA